MRSKGSRVARRAQAQHGLVTYQQLIDLDLPSATVADWLAAGRLESVGPRVYRVGGAPQTWEQSVMAAVLVTGGVASHRSAARFWELGDYSEVEVTVPRSRRGTQAGKRRGIVVHRSLDLGPRFVTRGLGIPVTNPMRTLVDLGAVVPEHQVADAVERAIIARLCTGPAVELVVKDVAKRGRSGAGVLRRVVEERALGGARPDSLLEARMARLLRAHGLPMPRFQYRIRGIATVDFAYPATRTVIEVDGFEAHGTPSAFQKDLARQNKLVAAGWTVLRFTWLDLIRRPVDVVALIRGRACA